MFVPVLLSLSLLSYTHFRAFNDVRAPAHLSSLVPCSRNVFALQLVVEEDARHAAQEQKAGKRSKAGKHIQTDEEEDVRGDKADALVGKVSGGVYHGGEAHLALMNDVYAAFDVANSLHPDVWPSVMKFEAEVIAMTANLMNGGFLDGSVAPIARDVCGCMTSGGTESIVCATKAHREWARAERGIDPDDAARRVIPTESTFLG